MDNPERKRRLEEIELQKATMKGKKKATQPVQRSVGLRSPLFPTN